MKSRRVNLQHPNDRIFRIAFYEHFHTSRGHPLDFVMRLYGINRGNYGAVSLSRSEMRQLREAIDFMLQS
jgi:hypothetical protein